MQSKKKKKIHEINLHIYPQKVWFVKKKDNEMLKCFEWAPGIALEPDECPCVYTNVKHKKTEIYGALISLHGYEAESTIVHECIHAALGVFKEIGVEDMFENQKPFCYLTEYIFEELCKILKDNR